MDCWSRQKKAEVSVWAEISYSWDCIVTKCWYTWDLYEVCILSSVCRFYWAAGTVRYEGSGQCSLCCASGPEVNKWSRNVYVCWVRLGSCIVVPLYVCWVRLGSCIVVPLFWTRGCRSYNRTHNISNFIFFFAFCFAVSLLRWSFICD